MSDTYTKLFSSITASTIWLEPSGTRLTWITMLAMADRHGCIYASVPGLADRAKVSRGEVEAALACFLAPDPDSRTQEHEGRRIEVIDGGWRLLNHGKFRDIRSAEERRIYMREYMREKRERERALTQSLAPLAVSTPPAPAPSPDKSKEPDQKKSVPPRKKRAALHPMPEGFSISPRVEAWAEQNGHTRLQEHFDAFVMQAKARAYVYADWDAALMTAIRKDWAQLRNEAQRPTTSKNFRAASKLQEMINAERDDATRGGRSADSTPAGPRITGPAVRRTIAGNGKDLDRDNRADPSEQQRLAIGSEKNV